MTRALMSCVKLVDLGTFRNRKREFHAKNNQGFSLHEEYLIKYAFIKAGFFFNNQLSEQVSVALIGSFLGFVLVNMVMIELKEVIVKPLQQDGLMAPHALCR